MLVDTCARKPERPFFVFWRGWQRHYVQGDAKKKN